MNNDLKIKRLKDFKKSLYMIDMNNGFVNFGAMANPKYNELVPEQLELIKYFRDENELINFVLEGHSKDSHEFKSYPEHCILGTDESLLIPEFISEQDKPNARTYYKNCINGMLVDDVRKDIDEETNVDVAVFAGVCEDLCVEDFARTYARYQDQLNRDTKMFVVRSCVDTFDAPGHNRDEWKRIAEMTMNQAGIEYVDNVEELKEKVKKIGRRQ